MNRSEEFLRKSLIITFSVLSAALWGYFLYFYLIYFLDQYHDYDISGLIFFSILFAGLPASISSILLFGIRKNRGWFVQLYLCSLVLWIPTYYFGRYSISSTVETITITSLNVLGIVAGVLLFKQTISSSSSPNRASHWLLTLYWPVLVLWITCYILFFFFTASELLMQTIWFKVATLVTLVGFISGIILLGKSRPSLSSESHSK